MNTKTARRAPEDTPLTSARTAGNADELLRAMAGMPAAHPSRPAMRERAIEAWLPLARHLANRYAGRGEPVDDLLQTATVGDRPRVCVRLLLAAVIARRSSCRRRGTRMAQVRSRKCRLISPMTVGIA